MRAGLVLVGALIAMPLQAQHTVPVLVSRPATIRFAESARSALQALWAASLAAHEERVACLGGHRSGDTVYVERVAPLEPAAADSLEIAARLSIDRCGPPEWFGTVHTHIALAGDERPYPDFSGLDRNVMLLWVRRWRIDGTFCVLHSATAAHCELDGLGTL